MKRGTRNMSGSAMALALLALASTPQRAAAAPPQPKAIKLAMLPSPVLYTDGKGHYLLLADPLVKNDSFAPIFFGDGKRFYKQIVRGGQIDSTPRTWSFVIRDPRTLINGSSVLRDRHGGVFVRCGRRRTQVSRLRAHEAGPILKRAKLFDVFWQRVPHTLARDDDGRYFYVDRWRGRDGDRGQRSGFRLFVGVRGKMLRFKLRNIVADLAGEIFVTAKGRFKIIKGNKISWTAAGKTSVALTWVDPSDHRTQAMIYRELGPYQGIRLWRPCDDF